MTRWSFQIVKIVSALMVIGCGGDSKTSTPIESSKPAEPKGSPAVTPDSKPPSEPDAPAPPAGRAEGAQAGSPASPSPSPSPSPTPDMSASKPKPSEGMSEMKPMTNTPSMMGSGAACEMTGTFALRQLLEESLAGVPGTEPIESDTLSYWSIAHISKGSDGGLALMLTDCGHTNVDICGIGLPPLVTLSEAYVQYVPAVAWDKAKLASSSAEMTVTDGKAFSTSAIAQVVGLSLTDPLGEWPKDYTRVEGSPGFAGSSINGAKWVDVEGDGAVGITSFHVPPGGVAADPMAGPFESYGMTSPKCPRDDTSAPRSPYAYLPGPDGASLGRIKRFASAQRLIGELHGTFEGCDRITGEVTGAGGGAIRLDTLVGACALVDGSAEKPCPTSLLDIFKSQSSQESLKIVSGKFAMVRVAAEATCEQARAASFD